MKQKITLFCLIVALLSILSSGTLAYRVVYGTSENVIAAGNIRAQLHSTDASGAAIDESIVCMPGSTLSRVVTVENTGGQPFFVRISLKKYVKDASLSAEACLNLNLNTQDWISQDGFYYYKDALQPGHTTTPLFTTVEIDGENVDNDYLGKILMLDVSAYAVQSKHNKSTVLEAVGWPEA